MLEEFFYYLEPSKITQLAKRSKEHLIVFCYKGIDYINNKEIRRSIFSILLEIMDSFDNITSDIDFLLLLVYSIDFQNLIINKNHDIPSSIYDLISCKNENTYFTGDLQKLLKENSEKHPATTEEFTRVRHRYWLRFSSLVAFENRSW